MCSPLASPNKLLQTFFSSGLVKDLALPERLQGRELGLSEVLDRVSLQPDTAKDIIGDLPMLTALHFEMASCLRPACRDAGSVSDLTDTQVQMYSTPTSSPWNPKGSYLVGITGSAK